MGAASYDVLHTNVMKMDFPVVRTRHADVDGPAGPTIANPKASTSDDPVDGDSAVACSRVARAHRTGDE